MAAWKLSRLELEIMGILWRRGPSSIPDILDALGEDRPAYTTIQTVVYRLEWKKAISRAEKKAGNAHVFEPVVSQASVQRRMIDELVRLFGGRALPILTHLIDSGKLTRDEVKEAQQALQNHVKKGRSKS